MCGLFEGTVIFLANMGSPFGCYMHFGCWFNHGQDVIWGLPDIFDELRPGGQYHPRLQSGDFEYTWVYSRSLPLPPSCAVPPPSSHLP